MAWHFISTMSREAKLSMSILHVEANDGNEFVADDEVAG